MVKKLLPIFTSLLIFNSCATYVNVKIQKPASISLGNVKNVAVMDVADDEFIGSYSFTEVGDAPLSEKLETILETIIEGKKKPKSPDLKNAYSGKTISDKIITSLVKNGHYSVVNRSMLDKILNEQKLSMSGIVTDDNVTKIGEMLGVDAVIIGTVSSGKIFTTAGSVVMKFLKLGGSPSVSADLSLFDKDGTMIWQWSSDSMKASGMGSSVDDMMEYIFKKGARKLPYTGMELK